MRIYLAISLLYQLVIVGFFANAFHKQPTRLKARLGLAGNLFFLAFEIFVFVYAPTDPQDGILFVPLAVVAPLLLSISVYRTYSRWDRKYWDTKAPDFLGWIQ